MARKPRGLGDTLEQVIKATGLDKLAPKDCGCQDRKEWLNEKFPYVNTVKSCMTPEQREAFGDFLERNPKILVEDDQKLIHSLYNSVLQTNVGLCPTCGAAEWLSRIDKLKRVYESTTQN